MDMDDAERSKVGVAMEALVGELTDTLGEIQVLASDDVAKDAEAVLIQVSKILGTTIAELHTIKAEIDAGTNPSELPSTMLDRVLEEVPLKPARGKLIGTMKGEIEL